MAKHKRRYELAPLFGPAPTAFRCASSTSFRGLASARCRTRSSAPTSCATATSWPSARMEPRAGGCAHDLSLPAFVFDAHQRVLRHRLRDNRREFGANLRPARKDRHALRPLACCRAPKLATTPSLSMHMRSDVVRRHDDSVVVPMTAKPAGRPDRAVGGQCDVGDGGGIDTGAVITPAPCRHGRSAPGSSGRRMRSRGAHTNRPRSAWPPFSGRAIEADWTASPNCSACDVNRSGPPPCGGKWHQLRRVSC